MKRFHVAIGVTDIEKSVRDYSRRLGSEPCVVVPDEYALWRTETLNFSIRKTSETPALRHLGWEDPEAPDFSVETDENGIAWERFSAEQQDREIDSIWPRK